MAQHFRDFFTALACLKITKHFKPALWTMVGSMLFIATSQTTAYGLEFPMTTRLSLPASKNLTAAGTMPSVALISQTSEMALVAYAMEQVNQAREELGAKRVAKAIMNTEYSWGDEQYSCLNRLWTKESNWNYKARNKRTGAHGIPQALPANRMEIISSDWRKNPVTQMRWGLRYIDIRYETPCKAWAKFKRSKYY